MIYYNITEQRGLQANMVPPCLRPVGAARVRLGASRRRLHAPLLPLLASLAVHVAVFSLTFVWVSEPPTPVVPEDRAIEMVFEPPAEPPAAAEPATPEAPETPPPEATEPQPPAPVEPDVQPPPPTPLEPPSQPEPPPVLQAPEPPPPVQALPEQPPPPPPPRAPVHARPHPAVRPTEKMPSPPEAASPAREAAPAPSPSPPVAAQPVPVVDADWARSVSAWLEAHRTYPPEARRRGEQGRVTLRFTVDRTGRVDDVDVVKSSGSLRLDNAALDLLRAAALPLFAPAMTADRVTITLQIGYRLSD